MKKCMFCAEEIQDEAIVCRYCGRDQVSSMPKYKMSEGDKKVLERWGYLSHAGEADTNGAKRYPRKLIKDALLFTIVAYGISIVTSLVDVYQHRLGYSEFWGRLFTPGLLIFFIVGLVLSWVWGKLRERFSTWASFLIIVIIGVVLSMIVFVFTLLSEL